MATKIVTKNSSTASAVPTASDLVQGELAVNVADKRLFTEDNGGSIVELGTNPSGDVTFQDNGKAIFGAGSDLQIYHDGSNSLIKDVGAGDLNISAGNDLRLQDSSGNNYFKAGEGGSSKVYYAGAEKLATTATGIDVTGTATMDGLTVESAGTTGIVANISNEANEVGEESLVWVGGQNKSNYGVMFGATPEVSTPNVQDHSFIVKTNPTTGLSHLTRLKVSSDGDISFYEDTGTTPKFFWDASAESLQLSGAGGLVVQSTSASATVASFKGSTGFGLAISASAVAPYVQNIGTAAGEEISLSAGGVRTALFQDGGDISFYEDTGTTAKFFWDASAESLGIGESAPSSKLVVGGNGNSTLKPTVQITDGNNGASLALRGRSPILFFDGTAGGVPKILMDSQGVEFKDGTIDSEGSVAVKIDSSNNVGIGTSSPSSFNQRVSAPHLVVGSGSNSAGLTVYSGTSNQGSINFADGTTTTQQYEGGLVYSHSSNYMSFHTNSGSERMRIDSSGNLLVGKTTADNTSAGITLYGSTAPGAASFVRDGGNTVILNRLNSDGEILSLRKDGTAVGTIGVKDSDIYIGKDAVGLSFDSTGADGIRPFNTSGQAYRDNAIDLGGASARFDDIYATNGTIQTSDRNEKQDIAELSDAEQRVAVACKGLLRKFRWKDSVAEKGDEARIHFGIIAQDLQAAFAAEGLDAGDYAMFISTTWTDEETNEEKTRMGVRYSELLAFIIAAL